MPLNVAFTSRFMISYSYDTTNYKLWTKNILNFCQSYQTFLLGTWLNFKQPVSHLGGLLKLLFVVAAQLYYIFKRGQSLCK